jgi:hypothetical protein
MRRSRVPSNGPGRFFAAQFSAGCTTNMSGSDIRQAHRCGRLVPDAHGAQSARDDAAIDPVAIADEVLRSLIPGKCLGYLTCNPFCRRMCCDVDPDEASAVEPDNDEGIAETDSWNNEQVHLPRFQTI